MKAVVASKPGGPEVLELVDFDERPDIGVDDVLIRVRATVVNRLDLRQRKEWQSDIPSDAVWCPGLECSGEIISVGQNVTKWKVGDEVCALLDGGGYAEEVVVSARLVLPLPPYVPIEQAASLPQVVCTAWHAVFINGHLKAGGTILVYGNCGDVGIFAIQMARHARARVFVATESQEQEASFKRYGADVCINRKTKDFFTRVMKETGEEGVDVILDCVAANFQRNQKILKGSGVLLVVNLQGSPWAIVDLAQLMGTHMRFRVINIQTQDLEGRAFIINEVEGHAWPNILSGVFQPVVHKVFPLESAADVHRLMERKEDIEKIILRV